MSHLSKEELVEVLKKARSCMCTASIHLRMELQGEKKELHDLVEEVENIITECLLDTVFPSLEDSSGVNGCGLRLFN
jgi:hypothetical protein